MVVPTASERITICARRLRFPDHSLVTQKQRSISRLLWFASSAYPFKSLWDSSGWPSSMRSVTGQHPVSFRRAGLYGISHTGSKGTQTDGSIVICKVKLIDSVAVSRGFAARRCLEYAGPCPNLRIQTWRTSRFVQAALGKCARWV